MAAGPTRNLFRILPTDARVLLIRLRSMGDCLLLTGPIGALKAAFPSFRVSVLVEPRFAACFDGNPDVDEILVTGPTKYGTARRLLSRRFEAILNLHGGPTSLMYACAARGQRIGVEGYQYARLYSAMLPRPEVRIHTVEATMGWFRWLGAETENAPSLYYAAHPDDALWVKETMRERRYVVIHPAAIMGTKRWAPERFGRIGRMLADNGWCPVLTAGPGEEHAVAETARHLSSSVVLLGLTIPRLAELIRGAALYVGNDSGPMHLAAAVGTPTVAVWGSSDSVRWHPWGVPHRVVENPFDCNPCPGYRCLVAATPLCIESVGVDQVASAIWSMIRPDGAGQVGDMEGSG